MELIKKETTKRNTVTVIVIHDINIVLRHSHYVLILKNGKLIADGIPETVITPQDLANVYGVNARIERCSRNSACAHWYSFIKLFVPGHNTTGSGRSSGMPIKPCLVFLFTSMIQKNFI